MNTKPAFLLLVLACATASATAMHHVRGVAPVGHPFPDRGCEECCTWCADPNRLGSPVGHPFPDKGCEECCNWCADPNRSGADVERTVNYPDAVSFQTKGPDGLVWPLPDSSDLVSVFIHGLHCKKKLESNHTDSAMGRMHTAHCGQVVKQIKKAVAETPKIDKAVCMTLFGMNSEYYKMRSQLGGYNYYTDDLLHAIDVGGVVGDARVNVVKLSGYNYGRLLMKEYRDAGALTAVERAYLDSWFEPVKAKQAAIAYVCEEMGLEIYLDKADPTAGVYDVVRH